MKKIIINLNNARNNSLDSAIKKLNAYKLNILQKRSDKFCKELIARGIKVATENGGSYGQYLTFTVENKNGSNNEFKYAFVGRKTQDLHIEWETGSYDVDPLLLAEFGSGFKAEVNFNVGGVGQGTMPNAKGHAFDKGGWSWKDLNGNWHHSKGYAPTHPVYKAFIEMLNNVSQVAKEVFR